MFLSPLLGAVTQMALAFTWTAPVALVVPEDEVAAPAPSDRHPGCRPTDHEPDEFGYCGSCDFAQMEASLGHDYCEPHSMVCGCGAPGCECDPCVPTCFGCGMADGHWPDCTEAVARSIHDEEVTAFASPWVRRALADDLPTFDRHNGSFAYIR